MKNDKKKPKLDKKNNEHKLRFWEHMMGADGPRYERHNHAVRRKGR